MPQARLFLVDAFNFIFRAFHARQRSGAPPMRTSRGSSTEAVYIFHNMMRKLMKQYQPEYLAVIYESEGPTFRDEAFAEYKANRAETPPELLEQIPVVERLLAAMRVPVVKAAGYEADDVIGTLARKAGDVEVWIVSSDKDMLQLVDDRVKMLDPMKNDTLYDPEKVKEFKGVRPEQIPDLLALVGDTADNIPGAPGIGDKGAVQLLEEFGSLDALLERAGEVQRKAYRESLMNNREQIELSKRLATIERDAPLEFKLEDLKTREPDRQALAEIYRELEFFSFLKELEPDAAAAAVAERETATLDSAAAVAQWIASLPAGAAVACVFAPPREGELEGGAVGLCARAGVTRAVPWSLRGELEPLWSRTLIVYDWKAMLSAGAAPEARGAIEDVLLLAFLALADPSACELDSLAARYLENKPEGGAAGRAGALVDLHAKISPLVDGELRRIYDAIDLPLAPVLARMERTGIRIETEELARLSSRMDGEIQKLTDEIYALAGKPFNINSPQQLGKILFEDLGLPAQGRTGKTKNYSTAADVLEALAAAYPIAQKVLDYRQLTKLKGTYVDALPQMLSPVDGRLHTTFNPAGAATGRLSSSNPNLQNIPARTELGREIRAAFVPEPGWVLLSADYSQIELRLLAHFSGDAVLVEAFRNNEDIHTRTAAEVFGVAPLMVTPEMRRNAKAVNFGIVYGQTAFGLASQLGIAREEAERYIRGYFERYSGVKKWIDRTIAEVRKTGRTVTLDGRRRPIPDIDSKNPNARSFAERTAVNTPLQGTAADLIKRAMIAIDHELAASGLRSRMLLQVHDELVLECPPEEVAEVSRLVKSRMEGVVKLAVPLLAETGTGPNWRDAK
jgi:DNA polymerase-1